MKGSSCKSGGKKMGSGYGKRGMMNSMKSGGRGA